MIHREHKNKPIDVDAIIAKENAQYMLEKRQTPAKWRWKLRMMNLFGFSYFIVYSFTALIAGHFLLLPDLYHYDENVLWNRRVLSFYIFAMLCTNYVLLVRNAKRSKFGKFSETLPTGDLHQWRNCPNCEILVPPRAKHCLLCDCCVLKRDHHCFFAASCIGFHNQRFFVVFCFYGILGAMFALYVTYSYLVSHYTPLFGYDFYGYLIPWLLWRWYSNAIHHSIVWLSIFLYLCVTTLLACSYFFGWQVAMLASGQTTYEILKHNQTYKRPLGENLRSVFGSWAALNFVFPLAWVRNEGDGKKWRVTCSLDEKEI